MSTSGGSWCVNYHGVGRVCDAGLLPRDLLDEAKSGSERVPCFREGIAIPCPYRRYPTPEEDAAREAESKVSGQRFLGNLANDICPRCERPITHKRQVGRCVYADPCGHRLYQGRL